jgi:hypothetical protein
MQVHSASGFVFGINALYNQNGMQPLAGNKHLDKLILEARETDAEFANALHEPADNNEYDLLTRLLKEACRR